MSYETTLGTHRHLSRLTQRAQWLPLCAPASLPGKGARCVRTWTAALLYVVIINLQWRLRRRDVVCAALPPSAPHAEWTDSKQVGPVAARRPKTPCSGVELAMHNGPIESGSRCSALRAAQIPELGLDPSGWLVGLGFYVGCVHSLEEKGPRLSVNPGNRA